MIKKLKDEFNNYDVVDNGEQVFEDITETIIEFTPIPILMIGDDNIIEYCIPTGFEEAGSDWVGIYRVWIFVLF